MFHVHTAQNTLLQHAPISLTSLNDFKCKLSFALTKKLMPIARLPKTLISIINKTQLALKTRFPSVSLLNHVF